MKNCGMAVLRVGQYLLSIPSLKLSLGVFGTLAKKLWP